MTSTEMAAMLDGREYMNEITNEECDIAKESGLVVVFGYSDDNVEFRGYIDDEVGVWEESEILIYAKKILRLPDEYACDSCTLRKIAKGQIKKIKAIYDGGVWRFETDIPHETFRIMEDGNLFCTGMVISSDNL